MKRHREARNHHLFGELYLEHLSPNRSMISRLQNLEPHFTKLERRQNDYATRKWDVRAAFNDAAQTEVAYHLQNPNLYCF